VAACLLLEYGVSSAAVAVGWSQYVNQFLGNVFGFQIPDALSLSPEAGGIINLPAVVLVGLCALLLIRGASESAKVNTVMVSRDRQHGRRDAVVDDDRRAPVQFEPRQPRAIPSLAAFDLLLRARDLAVEIRLGDTERAHHPLVEHAHAGCDRPDRELGVPRRAELPRDHHIERRGETLRYGVGDDDASARDAEDGDVTAADLVEASEAIGQPLPRLSPIAEHR